MTCIIYWSRFPAGDWFYCQTSTKCSVSQVTSSQWRWRPVKLNSEQIPSEPGDLPVAADVHAHKPPNYLNAITVTHGRVGAEIMTRADVNQMRRSDLKEQNVTNWKDKAAHAQWEGLRSPIHTDDRFTQTTAVLCILCFEILVSLLFVLAHGAGAF